MIHDMLRSAKHKISLHPCKPANRRKLLSWMRTLRTRAILKDAAPSLRLAARAAKSRTIAFRNARQAAMQMTLSLKGPVSVRDPTSQLFPVPSRWVRQWNISSKRASLLTSVRAIGIPRRQWRRGCALALAPRLAGMQAAAKTLQQLRARSHAEHAPAPGSQ